jgi:hypothetical protein
MDGNSADPWCDETGNSAIIECYFSGNAAGSCSTGSGAT